jgi:hypothetical protein
MEDALTTSNNPSENESSQVAAPQSAKTVDDQPIEESVGRAQAEGLQLTGEKGGLPQQLTKRLLEPALKGEVSELVEAADEKQLNKTIARYGRVDLLCIDDLGYMELDRHGAELLFQVLTEREEKNRVAIASHESLGKAHMVRRTRAKRR